MCTASCLGTILNVGGNSICGRGLLNGQLRRSRSTINGLCCGGNCIFSGVGPTRIGVSNSSVSLRVHIARKPRTCLDRMHVGNGAHLCRGMMHHRLHAGPNSLFSGSTLVHSTHRLTSVNRFSTRGISPSMGPGCRSNAISMG